MLRRAENPCGKIETSSRRIPAGSSRRTLVSTVWRSRVNPCPAPISEDGRPPFATISERAHPRHQSRSPLPAHPEKPGLEAPNSLTGPTMDFPEAKSFPVAPKTVSLEHCDTSNGNPGGTAPVNHRFGDPAVRRTSVRTTSITPDDQAHWLQPPQTTDPKPASARVERRTHP